MAEGLDPSIIPQTVGGVAGWIGTLGFGGLAAWLNFHKVKVDETAMILAKWREMTDSHAAALVRVEERLTRAQETIDTLRTQVFALQDEVLHLKSENAGLVRQIAQVSQSTITVLAATEKLPPTMQRTVRRLKGIEE